MPYCFGSDGNLKGFASGFLRGRLWVMGLAGTWLVVLFGALFLALFLVGVPCSATAATNVMANVVPKTMTHGASKQPVTPVLQPNFAYKADASQRLSEKLQAWGARHQQQPVDDGSYKALVWEAYKASNDVQPLSEWRFQGEPHPAVIVPRVVVTNPTEKAWLNLTVTLTVMAQWGPLQAKPPLWLLDTEALRAKTHWQPVSHTTFTVKVLAPDQTHALSGVAISLPEVLSTHVGEWPVQLGVIATLRSNSGRPSTQRNENRMTLIPNYLVPDPPTIRLP